MIDIELQELVLWASAPDVDARQNGARSVMATFGATSQEGRGYHVEFHVGQSVTAGVGSAAGDGGLLQPFERPNVCGDTGRAHVRAALPMPASPVAQTLALLLGQTFLCSCMCSITRGSVETRDGDAHCLRSRRGRERIQHNSGIAHCPSCACPGHAAAGVHWFAHGLYQQLARPRAAKTTNVEKCKQRVPGNEANIHSGVGWDRGGRPIVPASRQQARRAPSRHGGVQRLDNGWSWSVWSTTAAGSHAPPSISSTLIVCIVDWPHPTSPHRPHGARPEHAPALSAAIPPSFKRHLAQPVALGIPHHGCLTALTGCDRSDERRHTERRPAPALVR
jgi:hypothetical protein